MPTLRVLLRRLGTAAVMIGGLGTYFHLLPILRDLFDGPLDLDALHSAMSVAPPLLAPGGFAVLGAYLWLLGDVRVLRTVGILFRGEVTR
jgi:hypothetical protein